MARGKRKTNLEKLEADLAKVNESIEKYEETLKTLKATRKEFEEQIKVEKTQELFDLLKENDMSIDDLRDLLNTNKEAAATQA